MRARWGAVLFGIGVFAVVIAAGCAFYVAPSVARLPYDLALCKPDQSSDCLRPSVAEAKDAKFLQTKGGPDVPTPVVAVQTGTLRSTTEISPQVDLTAEEIKNDDTVIWNGYGTVKWVETDEMVSQYKAGLAIDRDTAAAVDWSDQFLQDAGEDAPSEVNFAGQLYKFPFGTEKKDYEYFDRDLRKAAPIQYQGTEEIDGLETYKFQQTIPDTPLNFTEERLKGLLATFAPDAAGGQVNYSNTRTIWVEPVSGTFIKVQEQQKKTLIPETGAPTALLDGNFIYTDETVANNVKSAGETKSSVLLISRYLPIGLAVLGALLLIIGLVMVTTGRRNSARHRAEEITGAEADAKA
ncbi:hypothetical protein Aab01nite_65710 [Paractinoplanes abujensis]|uniref:DUF3068 domain-containing protein n=1 Tax=Paractinoplanes abujensis TaxID=882441 RepID=A0A7W7CPV2_9ACTN|nr:DUF3068 domain-containing protein [Actinoplanes abujensis]MBB4692522.1 hypothetical protein [Actinoplanes abujensis]GID22981.1 hypothetical protein Aab01nite_65710 [Actinoplanes abujensis]